MIHTQKPNPDCIKGRIFRHKNGKFYIVFAADGCFYKDGQPVFGMFGGQTLRDGKPYGPMRDMAIANVAEWL
jgi:hypothetical protein